MQDSTSSGQHGNTAGVRRRILDFLSKQTRRVTSNEIADGAGLNKNSVRRELPAMLKVGLVTRDDHAYSLPNENVGATASTTPAPTVNAASYSSSQVEGNIVQGEETVKPQPHLVTLPTASDTVPASSQTQQTERTVGDVSKPTKAATPVETSPHRPQRAKTMCPSCAGTRVQENTVQDKRYLCRDCGSSFDEPLKPPSCPRCGLTDKVRRKTWKRKPGGWVWTALRCLHEDCKGVSFPLNQQMRNKHFGVDVYAYALYHMLKGTPAEEVSEGVRKFYRLVNEICPATLWNWVQEYVDPVVPYLLSLKIDTSGGIYLDEMWVTRCFTTDDGREYSVVLWLWTSYDLGKKTRPAAKLAQSRDASVAAEVIMRILARVRMPQAGITFWCDANSAYKAAYQDLVRQEKIDPEKVTLISVPKGVCYSVINPVEGVNAKWRRFLQKLNIDESLDLEKPNLAVQREIVVEDFFRPRHCFDEKSAARNANAEIDLAPNDSEAIIKLTHTLKAEQFKNYIVPPVRRRKSRKKPQLLDSPPSSSPSEPSSEKSHDI